MATAALPPKKLGKCANCLLFDWAKSGVAVKLQQCKQCKVLEYCGQACQEEHWKLIHKNHCKKMARAFEEEGEWSIFPITLPLRTAWWTTLARPSLLNFSESSLR